MLIHCVIKRENNLKCENIMGFGDKNAYIFKRYPDILQEVWEGDRTDSGIDLPMNIDLKVITKVRINVSHIIRCFKKQHATWAMDVAVCCFLAFGLVSRHYVLFRNIKI
jgi:hypothetical protein